MPYGIRIRSGVEEGELYPLFENREITIGRSPTNNIFIRDKNVSRIHCQIVVTAEGVTLTDLQSTNGTFVNEQRAGEILLKPGDEVRIGTTLLQLEESEGDERRNITDTSVME